MSEMMSTADIAANVVETAESTPIETSGPEPMTSTPAVDSTPAAPAEPAAPEPPPSKAELLLRKNGFKHALKPDGREHWLQRSRVIKILEEAFQQAEGEFTPTKTQLEQQIADYKARVEAWMPIAEALDAGPDAFLGLVTQRDPRYSIWQKPPEAPKPAAEFAMPEPDVPLPDGSRTYSVKGVQAALQAAVQQAVERAKEAAAEQLKPITQREQQEKERLQLESAASERRQQAIAKAETWPGFKEHIKEIEAAMAEDSAQAKTTGQYKIQSLHDAYIQVVVPKLANQREQILKEMQAAPTSTSIPRNAGETPKPSRPRTIEEIAREVVTKAS